MHFTYKEEKKLEREKIDKEFEDGLALKGESYQNREPQSRIKGSGSAALEE